MSVNKKNPRVESILDQLRAYTGDPYYLDLADLEKELPVTGFTSTPPPDPTLYISGNFRTGQKLLKELCWTGRLYCVVKGPFPHGFPRSLTRKTLTAAREINPTEITPRMATTNNHYALCRLDSIYQNHNQWGEICP